MVSLIHSSKANASILRWHESVIGAAIFAKAYCSGEFDFGLYEACVQALSSPRNNSQSDRVAFLQSLACPIAGLLESGFLQGDDAVVNELTPPVVAAEILLARSSQREAVICAVLIGRVDVLESLKSMNKAVSLLDSPADGLDPLELALYLSGRKGPAGHEDGLPRIKKNLDEYAFALEWLTLSDLDKVISFLVTQGSAEKAGDEHLSDISMSTLESKAESLLGIACLHGNTKHVEILIEGGADVNGRISLFQERAPLHIAAAHGNEEIVLLLLRNGAVPNLQDREGNTALHLACNTSNGAGVVQALLGKDADNLADDGKAAQTRGATNINIPDQVGWTALHHVAHNGNLDCCKLMVRSEALSTESFKDLLLAADYDRGSTALHIAAESGNPAIIEEILSVVRERDVEWPVEMCKKRVITKGAKNASSNQDQEVETLVSCNAISPYVNFYDLARYSALHRACAAACDSFIRLSKQAEEQDSFDKACQCIEVLVDNGADCLLQTIVGYVPLHYLLCGSQGGKNRMDGRLKNNDLSYVAFQKSHGDELESSIRRRFSSVDLLSNEWKENTLLTRPLSTLLNSAPSAVHISGKDSVSPLHCAGKIAQTVDMKFAIDCCFSPLQTCTCSGRFGSKRCRCARARHV